MTSRLLAVPALALATGALVLGGCGGGNDSGGDASSSPSKPSKPPASSGAGTVQVSADPNGKFAFDKNKLTAHAGKVTLDMKNPSSAGITHGIAVEGKGVDKDGAVVGPGKSSTVTVTLKPGKYEFYCPVPGHKAGGMDGTLTVQ